MKLFPVEPLPPLRPYQRESLDRGRQAIAQGASSVLIVQPTGCGKTRTAVEACRMHVELGGVPMFVAPRRELLTQATSTLERAGLEPGHDCFIRSIQELTVRGAVIPPATLVVLDEARHYVADTWSVLRRVLTDAIFLGLDATPERGDGRGLGGMFDVLIEAISVRDAIAEEYLVPCEVLRPERPLAPGELAQEPVAAWMAHARGLSTVFFCRSVEVAKERATQLRAAGVSAEAVWGEMPTSERDLALARFARGEVQVLTNMHLLTEGWDAPRTGCVVLERGFPTAGGMLQAVGRGLRLHPGKTRCLLIDLTGCTHVHGEPDEPRTWHLEGRAARRAADAPDVRFCPVCGQPVEGPGCEACGYSGAMKKRRPRVLGLPIDRFARQRAMSEEDQIKMLAQYIRVGRSKRYQPYWAIKRWEAVHGRRVTTDIKRAAMKLA